jgi:thioredoxin reductase
MLPAQTDVLIVGAGPAGLSAALELKRLGIKDTMVADREPEAGGTPRMCGHGGFGLCEFQRLMTGPAYARRYRELAERARIRIETSMSITGWRDRHRVSFTSSRGIGEIQAKAIVLATGVRERPRAARLIPGHRPEGVFTTGSLQRFVYEYHLPVGKCAVIIGAEIVSLSALLTLRDAGLRVASMITELPRHQLYWPIFLPAKILYADVLARAAIRTGKRITNILGRPRVEGIEITDVDSGEIEVIPCDAVVLTGDWISENELARTGNIETGKPSLGPQVDVCFRTRQRGIFAAGNVLRGVETAGWTACEGRYAARAVARFLQDGEWPENRIEVQAEAPLAWICPNLITADARPTRFRFRSRQFCCNGSLQVKQGGRVLYQRRFPRLNANVSLTLDGAWVGQVDFAGEPVRLSVSP